MGGLVYTVAAVARVLIPRRILEAARYCHFVPVIQRGNRSDGLPHALPEGRCCAELMAGGMPLVGRYASTP